MLELRVPPHVHHRSQEHGGVVLLNATTGHWHALNTTAAMLWTSWVGGAGFEQSVADVAGSHPGTAPELIRADANRLLRDLVKRGLVEATLPEAPMAAMMAFGVTPPGTRPSWRLRLCATGGLLLAVILLKLPFRVTCAVVAASRRWCRAAVPETRRAEMVVAAVRHVAGRYPGRAACLETSLAAVLLAALARRRLDWCLGAISDPYRFHAWVEIDGSPVTVAGDPPDLGHLRVLAL